MASSNVFFEFWKVKIELPESVFDLILINVAAELFVKPFNHACLITAWQLWIPFETFFHDFYQIFIRYPIAESISFRKDISLGRFDSIEWWSFNVRVFVNALLKPSWVFVLVNSFVDRIVQRGVFFGVIFFCYPWVLFQLIGGNFFQIRYSLDFFEEFFFYDVWVFSSVSYSTDPCNFSLFFLIIKRCIWIAYCQWLLILLLSFWDWV